MTFELSSELALLRDRARALATSLQSDAAAIDRDGAIAERFLDEARHLFSDDVLALVVTVEELAVGSAAAAIAAASRGGHAAPFGLSGLRGATGLEAGPRSQLILAAAALGIGRSAMNAALADLRTSKALPGADVEKPHWVVADVATELDAARLLTQKAAKSMNDGDVALARLMAAGAATRAVDAALRVAGADALKEGSVLERLARDVRAVVLVMGTEEQQRAVAAESLLPR
jgi:ABC-type branched-subunit amino acid transport system substrate-binding protein